MFSCEFPAMGESAHDFLTIAVENERGTERLAEKLDIPVKELSNTINRYYEVNFYEFINNYRILEAKRLLEDPEQFDKSITDVFYDAGFNSKSVYNTLFKKRFNKTPSQYRKDFKQQLAKQTA